MIIFDLDLFQVYTLYTHSPDDFMNTRNYNKLSVTWNSSAMNF